jgi:hypothetical protein
LHVLSRGPLSRSAQMFMKNYHRAGVTRCRMASQPTLTVTERLEHLQAAQVYIYIYIYIYVCVCVHILLMFRCLSRVFA